jgi:hypothetical protein
MGQTESTSRTHFSACEQSGPIQSHNPNYKRNSNHFVPHHNVLKLKQNTFNNEYLKLPPFLNDNMTLDYIHISKVMFVVRGVPESGRPIIVQHIRSLFTDAVVCSNSEYFMKCER